ncbi:MAG: hypothetical protein K2F97_04315, partial [Muribaculaceae bacterium]|nr:hypothetical protein [Muribaculaceae bacterium]
MGDAELKAVAENMGLKKVDPTQKEELIYRILDQQAVDRASAGAERRRASDDEQPEQKKRTRRKKTDEEAASAEKPAKATKAAKTAKTTKTAKKDAAPAETEASAEAPRKRRGRPSKKDAEENVTSAIENGTESSPAPEIA